MKRFVSILITIFLSIIICYSQKLKPSVTWNNIQTHPATLPVLGHIIPSKSDITKPSWWSVGCETLDRDYSNFENYKQFVGQTGVGYARLQSGWAKTEQKKGKYDFAWLDKHVDGLLEQGVHPWMCLCYGNPIYSDHGLDLNAKLFPDGPIMDGWLNYVRAIVKHFKGKVTMYEVWNEPDGTKNLDSYNLYANLFVRTAKVIRETDSEAKIAAFGSCSPDRKYIRQALKKIEEMDGMQYMDYLTYHAYWPVPENIIPSVKGLKKDLEQYTNHTQLLQGETGCPGQLEYGHAMKNIEWNEYSQAKWDLRQMLTHFGLGIPYSVFTMVDLNYGWMMQSFGLVRMNLKHEPIYLRPKFYAVQHVTSLFTSEIKPDTSITVTSSCGRKIQCVGLSKNGKSIGCALWFGDRKPSGDLVRENVSLAIHGLKMDRPNIVYVDLLNGCVHSIPELDYIKGALSETSTTFSELPLWDSPIVIINKNEVKFQ